MSAWPQIPKVSFQSNASSLGGVKVVPHNQDGSEATLRSHLCRELKKAPGTEDVPSVRAGYYVMDITNG